MREADGLRTLFHTLNNQLGIILSHAELLEAKATDDSQRARATQVVTATLEALATTRQIRHAIESSSPKLEAPASQSSGPLSRD